MPKLRKKYARNFTTISNTLVRDTRLSYKARGIFLYLWSLPDSWDISLADIERHSAEDGQLAVRTGVQELRAAGYVTFERVREHGRFVDGDWIISDEPEADSPHVENPQKVNPIMEEPILVIPTTLKYSQVPNTEERKTERENTEELSIIPHRDLCCKDIKQSPLPLTAPTKKAKRPKSLPSYSEGFLRLYAAYPKERRGGKMDAYLAWQSYGLEPRTDELIRKVEAHMQSKSWKEGFIPLISTWVNKARWDDDIPEPKVVQTSGSNTSALRFEDIVALEIAEQRQGAEHA